MFTSVSSPSVSFPARVRWHRFRGAGRRAPKLRCFAYLADVRAVVREIVAGVLPPNRRIVRQGVSVEVSSKNNGCASWKLCHCLCNLIPEVLLVLQRSIFLWCIPCQNGGSPCVCQFFTLIPPNLPAIDLGGSHLCTICPAPTVASRMAISTPHAWLLNSPLFHPQEKCCTLLSTILT